MALGGFACVADPGRLLPRAASYYCVINEEHHKKGNREAAQGCDARSQYVASRWKLDYAVRNVREVPRGWNCGGTLGTGSSSLPARTEEKKRLLSVMRNP